MSDRASCWPLLPASPGDRQAVGPAAYFMAGGDRSTYVLHGAPVCLCLPAPTVKCEMKRNCFTVSQRGNCSYFIPKLQRSEFHKLFYTRYLSPSRRSWVSIPFAFALLFPCNLSISQGVTQNHTVFKPSSNLSAYMTQPLFNPS